MSGPADIVICPHCCHLVKDCTCSTPRYTGMRTFETGATRDTDQGKMDYEGFFSPKVLERRAEYMHKHRTQSDGTLRDSANWQKGIPKEQYVKSLFRHFMGVWKWHRTGKGDIEEALCALMFNAEGLLFELLRTRE